MYVFLCECGKNPNAQSPENLLCTFLYLIYLWQLDGAVSYIESWPARHNALDLPEALQALCEDGAGCYFCTSAKLWGTAARVDIPRWTGYSDGAWVNS